MLVNNKIKSEMEKQLRKEARIKMNRSKNQSEAEEINKLIQNMSSKLPRSENDEFESNSSNDESKKISQRYPINPRNKKSHVDRTRDRSWKDPNETYSDLDGDIFSTSINLSSIDRPSESRRHKTERQKRTTQREKSSSNKYRKTGNNSKHSRRVKEESKISEEAKGKSGEMLMEGAFSENFEDESICAIHHKDLDMICQEPDCETPICSSCILFGDHKNHCYIEKDKFFKSVELKRKALVRLAGEIESAELKLNKTNQMDEIFLKIRDKRKKMEKELEFNCAKAIRQIENRKIELEKTTKVYFEHLEEKVNDYLKQTPDCIDLNQNWKRQYKELLRHLADESEEIENCFEFLKKMESYNISENGRRSLNAIAALEEIIQNKIDESIRSFDFRIKNFDENYIQVNKQNLDFTKNLTTIMEQLLIDQTAPRQDSFYQNNFEPSGLANEPSHGEPDYRVSDLMNENFNPEGSNLMMGLNNQEPQYMTEPEPYNDM